MLRVQCWDGRIGELFGPILIDAEDGLYYALVIIGECYFPIPVILGYCFEIGKGRSVIC